MHIRGSIRAVLATCLAAIVLAAMWIVFYAYAWSQVPTSNRVYAETWRDAPIADLLQAQTSTPRFMEMKPGADGTIVKYHFSGWRGMKGHHYPGSPLAFMLRQENLYMESGPRIYTPPVSLWCGITFSSDAGGIIKDISYEGDDCE